MSRTGGRLIDHFQLFERAREMEGIAKKILVLGIMTGALSILLLGCGSSSDTGTSGPLRKAQFLKEGNQICKKRLAEKDAAVKAALEQSGATAGGQPSKQLRHELGESIFSVFQAITQELSDLSPPSSGRNSAEGITEDLRKGLKDAEKNLGNLAATDPFEDAAGAARAYGFRYCNF